MSRRRSAKAPVVRLVLEEYDLASWLRIGERLRDVDPVRFGKAFEIVRGLVAAHDGEPEPDDVFLKGGFAFS